MKHFASRETAFLCQGYRQFFGSIAHILGLDGAEPLHLGMTPECSESAAGVLIGHGAPEIAEEGPRSTACGKVPVEKFLWKSSCGELVRVGP